MIYIIKLGVVKHILVAWLKDSKPQYLVVWQNYFVLRVSLNITTILAMLKPAVSPSAPRAHF
jgi:hypothetical protein